MKNTLNKICNNCKKELPLKDFRKRKNKDERVSICKSCCKSLLSNDLKVCSICDNIYPYTSEYFSSHHKDGLDTRCKKCANTISINWQKEHKERTCENAHRYLQTDKGKKTNRSKVRRYEARKQNVESTLTNIQWTKIKDYFNNKCAYCGKKRVLQQEHFIPLSKGGGYTQANIIPACWSCNSSKRDKDFFEWYPNQSFYSKEREEKIKIYLKID